MLLIYRRTIPCNLYVPVCLFMCFKFCFQSVQHENSYRNAFAKHCFGENPPELQALVT